MCEKLLAYWRGLLFENLGVACRSAGLDPLWWFFRNSDDRENPGYQLAVGSCQKRCQAVATCFEGC
jgi:hypothetical protein